MLDKTFTSLSRSHPKFLNHDLGCGSSVIACESVPSSRPQSHGHPGRLGTSPRVTLSSTPTRSVWRSTGCLRSRPTCRSPDTRHVTHNASQAPLGHLLYYTYRSTYAVRLILSVLSLTLCFLHRHLDLNIQEYYMPIFNLHCTKLCYTKIYRLWSIYAGCILIWLVYIQCHPCRKTY